MEEQKVAPAAYGQAWACLRLGGVCNRSDCRGQCKATDAHIARPIAPLLDRAVAVEAARPVTTTGVLKYINDTPLLPGGHRYTIDEAGTRDRFTIDDVRSFFLWATRQLPPGEYTRKVEQLRDDVLDHLYHAPPRS